MDQAVGALRALAILVAIWGLIGLIGFLFGVLPPAGTEPEQPPLTTADAGAADAGTAEAGSDAGGARVAAPVDAGRPVDTGTALAAALTAARYHACDGTAVRPRVLAMNVLGSPAPELVLACGSRVDLVAVESRDGARTLLRVARFEAASSVPDTQLAAASAASGDVTGDGRADLVLGFVRRSGAEARGGDLFLVEASAAGGFGRTVQLAPIAAADVLLTALDDTPGLEVVAMSLGNALARRPSEAWIFRGGASPVRIATRAAGIGGCALAAADLDRDGHMDIAAVATESGRLDVWFGDGQAGFPRSRELTAAGGTGTVTADLDADGAADVVVAGTGLHAVFAAGSDALEVRDLPGPRSFVVRHALDLDGDRRVDLAGLLNGQPTWARQSEPLTFEERSMLLLQRSPLAIEDMVVADLDADGTPELALLGRASGEASVWELVIAPVAPDPRVVQLEEQVTPIADAPLVLNVALR